MTIHWNWGAISRVFAKALTDAKDNVAPKSAPPMTGAEIAAALDALQADLPAIISAMKRYQGIIAGAEDVLDALNQAGIPFASQIETGLEATPGALAQAQSWLPWILPFVGGGSSARPLDSESENFKDR